MKLASFKNFHVGKKIIVCGCGESALQLKAPERFIVIGISDIGRLFNPDYLVVSNHDFQYEADRFFYIQHSKARWIFSNLPTLRLDRTNVVRFRSRKYAGVDFDEVDTLNYTNTSAYLAVCLAVHMGGNPIGIIGVDFTDNHFFAKTGPHTLSSGIDIVNAQFGRMANELAARNICAVNLSAKSRLEAFEKVSLRNFATL